MNLLSGRSAGVPAEVVAERYASACEAANNRLSRVEAMLENGSEIEALQVAEEPPRLMPQIELLSFGDEVEWQRFCEERGNVVAPLVDFRRVETLAALYEKGLSPNHPMYREYRSAVLSRDDDKAFELIQIIARLNPSDVNAGKEKHRLGRKAAMKGLERVSELLERGEDDELVRCMDAIEASAPDEDFKARPVWGEACVRRDAFLRRQARDRAGELLEAAEESLASGNWREAAAADAEIESIQLRYGSSEVERFEERLSRVREENARHRAEAERQGSIAELRRNLAGVAEDVEALGLTPEGIGPIQASSKLEMMRRFERELQRLDPAAVESLDPRIVSARKRLQQVIDRSRSGKRLRHTLIGAVGAVLLVVGGGFGYFFLSAASFTGDLNDAMRDGSFTRTQSIVSGADRSSWIFRFPSASSSMAGAEQWLSNRRDEEKVAERMLRTLEEKRAEGFAGMAASELQNELERCQVVIEEVAQDLRVPLEGRLTEIRNAAEQRLFALQGEAGVKAVELAQECERMVDSVDYSGFAEDAATLIEPLRKRLVALKPMLEEEDPALGLPAEAAAQLVAATKSLEGLEAKIEEVRAAGRALADTEDLIDFKRSLEQLAQTRFAEAGMARAVIETIPGEEKLKAMLLTDGNILNLRLAAERIGEDLWAPEQASEEARSWVSELRDHPCFADVYLVILGSEKGFSFGEPDGKELEFAERPKEREEPPEFRKAEVESRKVQAKESPASKLLGSLGLFSFLDDTGTEYERSALELVDKIMDADNCPALARAYLLGEVFELIRGHEVDWGASFSPSLLKNIEDFRQVEGAVGIYASDWMLADGAENAEKAWEDYFAKRSPKSSVNEFKKNVRLFRPVVRAELSVCGRVDASGEPVFRPGVRGGVVLGVSANRDGGTSMCVLGEIGPGKELDPGIPLARNSPLILLPVGGEAAEFILAKNPPGEPLGDES
ncbi:hypothetical protein [Haloferula sp. A504]|uniref:hypothetical protein n=1 Tax=Haloferula sp. A504 TaxID=3373601 RepID=UPI0031C23EEE|nr:hypothetical protein [Verrucomicrobiaceae bacterium E54]